MAPVACRPRDRGTVVLGWRSVGTRRTKTASCGSKATPNRRPTLDLGGLTGPGAMTAHRSAWIRARHMSSGGSQVIDSHEPPELMRSARTQSHRDCAGE